MWPFNKKNTGLVSVFTDKQKEVLKFIDDKLIELHAGKAVRGEMNIKLTGVPFINTFMPLSVILSHIALEAGESYIPRSVALVIDQEGNWCFFYAVRDTVGSDDISKRLFIESLNRTNNYR